MAEAGSVACGAHSRACSAGDPQCPYGVASPPGYARVPAPELAPRLDELRAVAYDGRLIEFFRREEIQ